MIITGEERILYCPDQILPPVQQSGKNHIITNEKFKKRLKFYEIVSYQSNFPIWSSYRLLTKVDIQRMKKTLKKLLKHITQNLSKIYRQKKVHYLHGHTSYVLRLNHKYETLDRCN